MQQEMGPVVGLHAPDFTVHDEKNQSAPMKKRDKKRRARILLGTVWRLML